MSEPKVKSLVKAMRVLECFQQKSELGITEISQQLGLYKSNVHDILSTLEQLGYVDQVERNGRYRLGYKILELSHAFTSSMGFRRTVYPHMKRLAMDTGETVYLGATWAFAVAMAASVSWTCCRASSSCLRLTEPVFTSGV